MKTILESVTKRESIHNIVKVIDRDLNLDEKGKELILAMLALAWIEGANLALFYPQGVSGLLTGSRELRDLVSATMERIVRGSRAWSRHKLSERELSHLVMIMVEQEEVVPFSRINLEAEDMDRWIN